jgi:integrase
VRHPTPEEGSCPSRCSMPLAAVAHPRRCRSSMLVARRATRGSATRPIRQVEEIVAVMRHAGDRVHGRRLRGLIVVLWRAGLRIHEALALAEADLDPRRGSLLVRRGKGGRRREVGMDDWPGSSLSPGSRCASSCRSGRCSASSTARPADGRGRPPRHAPSSGTSLARRRATALRAAPATARARRRDGARGRAADRHPTPARSHQPRHHVHLPARHRQRRDH